MKTLDKRRPKRVQFGSRVYVPDKPTEFWVGSKTWHKDESKLQVRRGPNYPNDVWVSCLDDAQIVFPPAEKWKLRDVWDRLTEDEREPLVAIKVGEQGNGWTFVLDHTCRDKYPQAPKQVFVSREKGQEEFFKWMSPHQLSALVGLLTGCETDEVDLTRVVFLDPMNQQLYPEF